MFSVAYTDVANGVLMVIGIGSRHARSSWTQTGGFSAAIDSLPSASNQDFFGHYGAWWT